MHLICELWDTLMDTTDRLLFHFFLLFFLATLFRFVLGRSSSAQAAISITRLILRGRLDPSDRCSAASLCAAWIASVTSRMYRAASPSVWIPLTKMSVRYRKGSFFSASC